MMWSQKVMTLNSAFGENLSIFLSTLAFRWQSLIFVFRRVTSLFKSLVYNYYVCMVEKLEENEMRKRKK